MRNGWRLRDKHDSVEISEDTRLAVKRGAEWLDERAPGWEEIVALDYLRMEHCKQCMVGQVMGNFYDYFMNDEYTDDPTELGFMAAGGLDQNWVALEAAWTELVEERRG